MGRAFIMLGSTDHKQGCLCKTHCPLGVVLTRGKNDGSNNNS